jgi:hypothetical protein
LPKEHYLVYTDLLLTNHGANLQAPLRCKNELRGQLAESQLYLHKRSIGASQKITDCERPVCCVFATDFKIHISMRQPTINCRRDVRFCSARSIACPAEPDKRADAGDAAMQQHPRQAFFAASMRRKAMVCAI